MYRVRRHDLYNLVEDGDATFPERHIIYFNNNPNNKKNCVICYITAKRDAADFNLERDYARSLNLIIESLKKHNFDGHLIYYIGGWPGLKQGRLKYIDVPYSFKPFLFEEARDLGYENVLWLDACSVPVKSLDPFFKFIEDYGLCFILYGKKPKSLHRFNLPCSLIMPFLDVNKSYQDLTSQVVGLNMKNAGALRLLDAWIKAAEDKVPFLQSDEPPFVVLINNLDLLHGQLPTHFCVETRWGTGKFAYWDKNSYAIIYHQFDFMCPKYPIPADLFDH